MNHRPSEKRLKWTVPALNFCLDIQHDIINLTQHKNDTKEKYMNSTLPNAEILEELIYKKLGINNNQLIQNLNFNPNFWYTPPNITLKPIQPPSNKLEKAFDNIEIQFVKHQDVFDINPDKVVLNNNYNPIKKEENKESDESSEDKLDSEDENDFIQDFQG